MNQWQLKLYPVNPKLTENFKKTYVDMIITIVAMPSLWLTDLVWKETCLLLSNQRMESVPHTLDTIPGFGPGFSAGIIAEIRDIQRFNSIILQ